MTPTQGEHAQTEALRPIQRFEVVDCIDSKHVPAVIPRANGPWVRYEDHAARVAALTAATVAPKVALELPAGDTRTANVYWSEMRGDTLHLCISVDTPAQPAAPQGVANAELRKEFDLWWNDQMGNEPGRDTSSDSRAFMPYKAWKEATNRASNGQAPAGAAVSPSLDTTSTIADLLITANIALSPGQEQTSLLGLIEDMRALLYLLLRNGSALSGSQIDAAVCAWNDAELRAEAATQLRTIFAKPVPVPATPTAQAAPAAGAVAGHAMPAEFLRSVIALCTQRGYSPENIEAWSKDDKWVADLWRKAEQMLAAAPTPAAQADSVLAECGNCFEGKSDFDHVCKHCGGSGKVADSVLEDAALLHYALADGGNQSMNWQDVYDDWNGEGYFIDALRAAYKQDAARKQGGA